MEVRSRTTKAATGERPLLQGTAAEVAGDIQQYAALGVTHFVWDPTHQDMPSVLDNLERFVHDVATRVGKARARDDRSVVAGAASTGRTAGGLARDGRGSARPSNRRTLDQQRKSKRKRTR